MEGKNQIPEQQQSQSRPGPQKAIRVLSIDGGGIRGVAVARILEGIEKETGKRIHELFDVVVGTSTGGLLSVMLCVEIPPISPEHHEGTSEEEKEHQMKRQKQIAIREILGLADDKVLTAEQAKMLYIKKADTIFSDHHGFWHKLAKWLPGFSQIKRFFHSKYEKAIGLQEVVQDLYINNDLNHARTCVGVMVTERGFEAPILLNSTNAKVIAKHNFHNNLSLTQVIRATSAAPTYFNPIHVHNPAFKRKKGAIRTQNTEEIIEEIKREESIGDRSQAKKFATCTLWAEHTLDYKLCEREVLFFEDGGVSCNNPSLKAFRYAKELLKLNGYDHHEYQFQVYSIGTGSTEHRQVDPARKIIREMELKGKVNSGSLDAFHRLVETDPFSIERMSHKNHLKIQHKLKSHGAKKGVQHKYFRLQFKMTEQALKELDRCDKKHLDYLISAAEECIEVNEEYKRILETLKVEVDRPKDLVDCMPRIVCSEEE